MKSKTRGHKNSKIKDTLWQDPSLQTSDPPFDRGYINEGDEFLDDAIRTLEQPFVPAGKIEIVGQSNYQTFFK